MTWSEKIKSLEARGWSLTQIAKEVETSTAAISEIKQGRTKAPTGMTAVRLYQLHERICVTSAPPANDDNYQEASA